MTRAKTQGVGGKPPRAATQSGGGKSKRAVTHSNLFNDLEAAIDSLDQSSARHAVSKEPVAEPAKPDLSKLPVPKRSAPGPSPDAPKAPRTVPPKPPPGASAIRAREARAASEIALDEVEEVATVPAPRVPPRAPLPTRPPVSKPAPTATRPLDADGLPPISAPPTRATPRPGPSPAFPPAARIEPRIEPKIEPRIPQRAETEGPNPDEFDTQHVSSSQPFTLELDESGSMPAPAAPPPRASAPAAPRPATVPPDVSPQLDPSGLSIDVNFEESQPAAAAYQPVVDKVVEDVAAQPSIEPLSIAILDEPPYIAAAKQAISVAGHRVAAAASGQTGIEQIKSLLRTGIADVLLVGVPGGEELIDTALALAPRRPVVIAAMSGKDVVRRAVALGADLVVARPLDVDKLAPVLLAASRLATARSAPAARTSDANLRGRLDAMADHEPGTLQPYDAFHRVFELEIKRSKRYGYPIAIALFSVDVDVEGELPPGMLGIVRARAGNALIQSIRDIDLATDDQERFLVLLPYTTLGGAAEVARRILNAVTNGTPISAGGRTFPPQITGAVAGAQPGEPLSISRLIRDATQALEEARRDGAELAVPMGTGE